LLKMVGATSRPELGVLLTQLHKTNISCPRALIDFRLPTNLIYDIGVFLEKLCAISDASYCSDHGGTVAARAHQSGQA